jgi:hypothetical protein
MFKVLFAFVTAVATLSLQVTNVFACGGLVAPNGSVRLARATTFVAWHDGVEHYMTSFAYEGDVTNLGWIVPLPAVPISIKEGGAWTLQRLEREFAPPPPLLALDTAPKGAASAQVLQRVQVEALDITVIRGSGSEVLDWCEQNGFVLPADTREHLIEYAKGSPIFMAAKYNVARVRARHQLAGDGAPVLITMKTPRPWVPLEVLANDGDPVTADLFMLTDQPLWTGYENVFDTRPDGNVVGGATGFTLVKEEQMSPLLFHDLSTDRNMSWVPAHGYVSYLTLNAPSETVTYDLAVANSGRIQLLSFGSNPTATDLPAQNDLFTPGFIWSIWVLLVFAAAGCLAVMGLRRIPLN